MCIRIRIIILEKGQEVEEAEGQLLIISSYSKDDVSVSPSVESESVAEGRERRMVWLLRKLRILA
jgi:hypothetical protein